MWILTEVSKNQHPPRSINKTFFVCKNHTQQTSTFPISSLALSFLTTKSHVYQEESEACTDLDQQVSEARIILQEEEKHHGEAERGQNR